MGVPTMAVQAAIEGTVAVRAEAGSAGGRMMFIWPMSVTAKLSVVDRQANLRFSREFNGDFAPATRQLAEWLRGLEAGPAASDMTLHLQDGVGVRLTEFHPRLTVVEFFREGQRAAAPIDATIAAAPAPRGFVPIPVSRPAIEPAATPSDEGAAAWVGTAPGQVAGHDGYPGSAAPDEVPPAKVNVSGALRSRGVELRFHWNAAAPAAVFEHRDELWLVFGAEDAEVGGWRSLKRPELAAWLEPEITRNAGPTRLFRLKLNRRADVSVSRESSDWIVQLTEVGSRPPPAGSMDFLRRDVRDGMLVAAVDGQVAQLKDPKTGERIGVLLAAGADVRQPAPVQLVDLELLASAQGLAWRPLADGVRGKVESDRFMLTRQGGLRLSGDVTAAPADRGALVGPDHAEKAAAGPVGEPAEQTPAAAGLPSAPLGLGALAPTTSADRQRQRHDLLADLAGLRATPQAVARLELARLFLADALGPEAGTVLDLVPADALAGPTAERLRQSRAALTGAAAALSGRSDTALAILLDRMLDQDPEVALWRAYAAARAMRSDLAAQELERSDGALDQYPAPLRRVLGLELASTLVERGDVGPALALLDGLRPLDLPNSIAGRLHVLAGLAMIDSGKPADAERELQAAEAVGDPDTRTRAAFLRVSMPATRGTVPVAAAAAAMAALRVGWRGHPWETRMLHRLAELQTDAGHEDDALASLEAAAATSPDPAAATGITGEIGQRVRRMLQAGDSIDAAPVAALARYRAYGRYLGNGRDDAALRNRLAMGAAASGMFATARALVGTGAAGSAEAAETDLGIARAEAASGDLHGALAHLVRGNGATVAGKAALVAELRARLALETGDPGGAIAALADSPADAAAPLRRLALFQTGDWTSLAESAASGLPHDNAATPLGTAPAEAAVWLSLAQAQLGHSDLAQEVAHRYGPQVDRGTAAQLQLAATVADEAAPLKRLPATVDAFVGSLRAALDSLPAGPGT